MKNALSSFIQKSRGYIGNSWLKVLVLAFVLGAPVMPGTVPVLSPNEVQAQGSAMPDAGAAEGQFSQLFRMARNFAGILLLIGTVIAGILFMTGKTGIAITVFLGAVIVFGGAYVIGLVKGSFDET